ITVRRHIGVPAVSGELTVGRGDEVVAMLLVLADEDDERWHAPVREVRPLPPPREEGVVAPELLVVLVETTGAVVLDEQEPSRGSRVFPRDLDNRVGADGTWPWVAETFG